MFVTPTIYPGSYGTQDYPTITPDIIWNNTYYCTPYILFGVWKPQFITGGWNDPQNWVRNVSYDIQYINPANGWRTYFDVYSSGVFVEDTTFDLKLCVDLKAPITWYTNFYTAQNRIYLVEPDTGKWAMFYGAQQYITDDWYYRGIVVCSDPAYNKESSQSFMWGDRYLRVYEDGSVYHELAGFWTDNITIPVGFFTPGSRMELWRKNIAVNSTQEYPHYITDRYSVTGELYDESESYNRMSVHDWNDPENPPAWLLSGEVTGPCVGDPASPFLERSQFTWCGDACGSQESLRNATSALEGRTGLVIDKDLLNTHKMVTLPLDVPSYPGCNPDVDGFIQSVNPDQDGDYHLYDLKPVEASVFGEGLLEGADLEMTFNVDQQEFDLAGTDSYFRFTGPTSLVFYGISGDVDFNFYFRDSTVGSYWTAEVTTPQWWATNSTQLLMDQTYEETLFDMIPGERTTGTTVSTIATADPNVGHPICQIDWENFVVLKIADNAGNYEISLNHYQFNFTTEIPVLQSSTSLWTDEPAPAGTNIAISNNRLCFAPDHGTGGRLYIGQPYWTGTKSNEGRIRVFDWNGSSFTETTALVFALRNGYVGGCLGYDEVYSRVIFGTEEDDLASVNSDGSAGPSYAGARGSRLGAHFAVGGSYIMTWDEDTNGPRLLRMYTSSIGYITYLNNYTYTCYMFRKAFTNLPEGPTGLRQPNLVMQADAGNGITSRLSSSYGIDWDGSAGYTNRPLETLNPAVPQGNTVLRAVWHNGLSYGWDLSASDWQGTGSDELVADDLDFYSPYYGHSMVLHNGVDKEFVISAGWEETSPVYSIWVTELGLGPRTHCKIGRFHVETTLDTSSSTSIISATLVASDQPLYQTYVWFFYKFSNDANYYVPDGVGGLTGYANFQDAKDNAADMSIFNQSLPLIDITSIDSITFYMVLEKRLTESYATYSPSITSIVVTMESPPLAEPIIPLHFNNEEIVSDVYKTTAGVIVAKTSSPTFAQGLGMITSGKFARPLFKL